LADHHVVVSRAGDRIEVGADLAAMLLEDGRLVPEAVERPGEVGEPGVLGGDAQRDLLAATGDPQRDTAVLERQRPADGAVDLVVLAVERRVTRAPQLPHDLHALVEHPEAFTGAREPVAVGAPLVFVPAAADAHLDPAAGD